MWWILLLALAAAFLASSFVSYLRYAPRPAKPVEGKRHIACIGDSITFGSGVAKTRARDAWAFVLERSLGDGYQVINYGISGATLQNAGDKPYRKVGFLRVMEQVRPQVILLMLGTNDSKPHNWDAARFQAEYEAMAKQLKEYPWPHRLILMTPPRAFPKEKTAKIAFKIDNGPIGGSIRKTVLDTAETLGLPCIDLYSLTQEHPEYFTDGVHPNQQGNQKIAEYILAAGLIS